jgi:hypothetical protein
MARPRLINGARILVYINNVPYGRCAGISWTSITPHKAARGVDVPYVLEQMPTTYAVTGSMQIYRMIGDGGAEGSGIQAPQPLQSKEKYSTLILTERDTDTVILQINMFTVARYYQLHWDCIHQRIKFVT